jgi:type IV pilus assembly protein PilV
MANQALFTHFRSDDASPSGNRRPKPWNGFSLVEVLASIVILSFGLLGMAALQSSALKANREARLQSRAVVLARDLAEHIRNNNSVGLLPVLSNPYLGEFVPNQSNPDTPLVPLTSKHCMRIGCPTNTDIAHAEMTEWLYRVSDQLPGAKVHVCIDDQPFDPSGTPRWPCSQNGDVIVIKIGWTRSHTNTSLQGSDAFDRAIAPAVVFPISAGNNL